MTTNSPIAVGVISDTHGLLRPEAVAALHASDVIIHAGDVGDPQILDRLRAIAPTYAVRGNVDTRLRNGGAGIWISGEAIAVADLLKGHLDGEA